MALGTPVIASAVGGLREVVVDLRSDPNGTGLLVRPEDPADMGVAMESLVQLMTGGSPHLIPIQGLRSLASPDAGLRVRGNCVKHVDEHFREHAVYSQVEVCYERARQMAYYRAVASAHMRVG
jgi:starch synthase